MNRMPLFTAVMAITIAAAITSCKSSRVWEIKDREENRGEKYERNDRDERDNRNYMYDRADRNNRYETPPPPGHYSSARLVISPSPGFVMNRYPDGRYYHRSRHGLLYWKGYDNRFFLDKTYLKKLSFSRIEYDEWKRYSRSR